jgi:hypothetical protein
MYNGKYIKKTGVDPKYVVSTVFISQLPDLPEEKIYDPEIHTYNLCQLPYRRQPAHSMNKSTSHLPAADS